MSDSLSVITYLECQVAAFDAEVQELRAKLVVFNAKVQELRAKVAARTAEIERLHKENARLSLDNAALGTQIVLLQEEVAVLCDTVNELQASEIQP